MDQSSTDLISAPIGALRWNVLLVRTYALYRKHFFRFFRIALMPAIVAYAYSQVARIIFHPLLRWPLHSSTSYSDSILWNSLVIFIRDSVYWCISAFFFAAIASKVLEDVQGDAPEISDSYSQARTRPGSLAAIALIAWTSFYLGKGLAVIAITYLGYRFGFLSNYWFSVLSFLLPIVVVAGLVSRFGLAIPELIRAPAVSIREAIRTSIRKTEDWEPFFMFFLVKSALIGYLVLTAAEWVLAKFRPDTGLVAYNWASWAVYICVGAMLESPLFIAFAILYRDSEFKAQDALSAPAIG